MSLVLGVDLVQGLALGPARPEAPDAALVHHHPRWEEVGVLESRLSHRIRGVLQPQRWVRPIISPQVSK